MSTSKGAIMTKAGSQQEPTRKALRQPRSANIVCAKGDDVCELFLAELEARRVRLQKLLRMVWTEAGRRPAGRAASRYLASCEKERDDRTA
jgi:hypothetical protein